MLSHARDGAEILARGRWNSLKSVKRYAKGGAVQRVLARLDARVRGFGQQCQQELEGILNGTKFVALPDLAALQVVNIVH